MFGDVNIGRNWSSEAKLLVLDWGIGVSGIGLNVVPAHEATEAGGPVSDNPIPMPESTISPCQVRD